MKKITILGLLIFTIALHGQNKLLSEINQNYDGFNWNNNFGYNYEYDANNNLIVETGLSWNFIDSKWENSDKSTYTYNVNNRVISQLDQDWNSVTNQFEDSYRSTFTYNGSGDVTEVIDEIWENGAWVNEYRSVFTYNGGRIDIAYFYEWDGAQWVAEDRSTLTYNVNNRVEKIDINEWDGAQWVIADRDLYTFDVNNKVATETYESWNGAAWVEEENIVYTIVGGNRTEKTSTYSGGSSTDNYVYDTTKLMSDFTHPFKDKTGFDFFIIDNPYFNKILSETSDVTNRSTYDYNNAITLSEDYLETVDNILSIFPNPTQGNITINSSKTIIDKIEIYGLTGIKVFVTNDIRFNINNLDSGVYFFKIFSEGNTIIKRIIKT